MLTAILLSCALSQYPQQYCDSGQCEFPQQLPQQPTGAFNATSPDGRPLIGTTQFRSTKPPNAEQKYGWHSRRKIREYFNPQLGEVLSDIEANMPADHAYRTDDRTTWAHETVHGISSALRVEVGEGTNGFYVGKGYAMILREPRMQKALVNRYVPQELRGAQWQAYMDNPQVNGGLTGTMHGNSMVSGWADQPLYILDEFNAYIAGMECAAELHAKGLPLGNDGQPGVRNWTKDLEHAIEFAGYAHALQKAIAEIDPQYPDRERLASFIKYENARIDKLVQTIGTPEHRTFLARLDSWRGNNRSLQANPQFVARVKSQNVTALSVDQRLDRIEQQLQFLAKGIK